MSKYPVAVSLVTGLVLGLYGNAYAGEDDGAATRGDHRWTLELGVGIVHPTDKESSFSQGSPLLTPAVQGQLHLPVFERVHAVFEVGAAPLVKTYDSQCGGFDCVITGPHPALLIVGVGAEVGFRDVYFQALLNNTNLRLRPGTSLRVAWLPSSVGVSLEYTRIVDGLKPQHTYLLMGRWSPPRKRRAEAPE